MNLTAAIKKSYVLSTVARRLTGKGVRNLEPFIAAVRQKRGLEIGGPSGPFRDSEILPLYRQMASLDNTVYSSDTPFTNDPAGDTFRFHPRKPNGRNLFCEATALTAVPDATYDFVLSCHSLEHCANPIKALKEWQRVTRPGGALIIILPHGRFSFDHRRPLTSLEHMQEDFCRDTGEDDMTHLAEMCNLHDFSRSLSTPEEMQRIQTDNFRMRCAHHHVFDETNSRALLEASGLRVSVVEFVRPVNLILLAHCPSRPQA